jgi:hypothetical protein
MLHCDGVGLKQRQELFDFVRPFTPSGAYGIHSLADDPKIAK